MESKLAEKLSALRVRAGLSQRDVAKRIGISTQSCSHYETGRRTPDLFILYRFSQLYQITMEYLLSASNPQPPQHLPSSLRSLSDEDLASLHLYLDYLAYRRTHIPSNEKEAPNN